MPSLKNIYGPGLAARLNDQLAQENAFTLQDNPEMAATALTKNGADPLVMRLRHKRQSALRKELLKNGGYGDLARMVSFHRGDE